jgi:hypothetical protein
MNIELNATKAQRHKGYLSFTLSIFVVCLLNKWFY